MAIIEVHGGPITHRYLMGKTKDDLAGMYMRLLRDTEQDARDAERYRWLREAISRDCSYPCAHYVNAEGKKMPIGMAGLDSAIDTAMKGANAQ